MKNFSLIICFFLSFNSFSQLLIDESLTASQLVQVVLVDSSVLPSNIIFNGQPADSIIVQLSKFSTGSNATNLGLNQGLILATADTDVALGPNNDGSASTFAFGGSYLDNDLIQIPGAEFLESSSVLEFDFIATGSELNFDFIFASEEYPEYSNSTYNDVFGFFLSGPDIAGPYSNNAKNIALIPETNTEITINNLNNGTSNLGPCEYCEFYVDNGTGQTPNDNPFIQYDGFTTVIRAKSDLLCGETYHIKLAVGNVGDNQYDSAVFIKNFNVQQSLELLESNNLPENTNVCFGESISIYSGIPTEDNIFVWTKDGVAFPGSGPSITVSEGGIYALNAFTAAGCKFAFDEILIGYRPEISVVDPPDINLCALLAASYTFPTINQNAIIFGTLNPLDYSISYYNSSYQDAISGSSNGLIAISNLDNYTVSTPSGIIWVRVEEVAQNLYGCVKVISFNINAYGIQTGDISYAKEVYCVDLAASQPVFSTASSGGVFSAIPNGLQLDATTGAITPSGSLGGNYTVIYSVAATGSCPAYSTPPTFVTINSTFANQPIVVSPVLYCKNEIVQPLIANGVDMLWYQSEIGGIGSAIKPTPDTSVNGTTIYYVSQSIGGCESQRAAITVMVSPIPDAPVVTPVSYCLNDVPSALTAIGSDLLWYDSAVSTLASSMAPIPNTTIEGNKTFYVSQTVNGCESPRIGLTVQVKPKSPKPQANTSITYCLNDSSPPLSASGINLLWYNDLVGGVGTSQAPIPNTSSIGVFNFYVSQNSNGCESERTIITVEVIGTLVTPIVNSPVKYCQKETAVPLTAAGVDLLWYTTITGGNGSTIAPIPQTTIVGIVTYYVSQTLNGCESPRIPIDVVVISPAVFSLPQDGILCANSSSTVLRSYVIHTELSSSSYSFEWYDLNTGTYQLINGANQSFLEVFEPGNYGVIAEDLITGCKSELVITNVSPVYPPADFNFTTSNYFVNPTALSVDVVPIGDYEYQIDEYPFQENPYFSDISFGPHTVTVRDINQCATLTKELFFVNYPKFFTPNGDGYNDTWNIKDLDKQLNSKIRIFDRFGKLIREIFPSGTGWDGTYNQNDMPSTDYWFIIYYNESNQNKEFRAHFSLKR